MGSYNVVRRRRACIADGDDMAEFNVVAAVAIVTVYARPMIAKLADVSGWVTIVAALAALIFGTFLGAL